MANPYNFSDEQYAAFRGIIRFCENLFFIYLYTIIKSIYIMKKYTSITIDKQTYEIFRKFCEENACSISKLTKKIILEYINEKRKKKY